MDERRVGQAQRRRIGASSNAYDHTMEPPTHGVGDTVKAKGRYGLQTVVAVQHNSFRPDGVDDGHAYIVRGGKRGRVSMHGSSELKPYVLECFGCGETGDNTKFGFGNARQCPSCGSFEVHGSGAH